MTVPPLDARLVAEQLHAEVAKRRVMAIVPLGLALLLRGQPMVIGQLLDGDADAAALVISVLEPPPAWFRNTALGCACSRALSRGPCGELEDNFARRMLGLVPPEFCQLVEDGSLRRIGPRTVEGQDVFQLLVAKETPPGRAGPRHAG